MPIDKLEGSSVMNSVVDNLFVDCFNGVFVLVHFWSIQPGLGDVPFGR